MRKLSSEELGRISEEEFKNARKNPVKVILDNIRSGSNTGSIFRTCDAFAIEELILLGLTPTPPHREILKTALGATASVKWTKPENGLEYLDQLKSGGYKIIAVEQTSKSKQLDEFSWPDKTAIVLGNEVEGVSDEVLTICDFAVEIRQSGTKHSLNVAVAGGIVLWEIFKK